MHDLTWREPDYGLARLEAAVATNPSAGDHGTLSDALAIRAKADLLSCAGRIHEVDVLLKAGARSRFNRYHLVSEARMHLCGHDGAQAIRVAEAGVHDSEIPGPARAHLHAIRSAGLLLVGASPTVVRDALREACTLATELVDVLPFVFIPAHLRSELLKHHDQLTHEAPCILDDVVIRERLGRVWSNLDAAPMVIRLTRREELLLPLLATTKTIDVLAKQLQVSSNTVRKQVATLRHKFGAPSRAAMIATAHELGLLGGPDK
jgi:DNA-binding NarL/FixJ family response regulator